MKMLLAVEWQWSALLVERLGWVLVHSLWQFALVALLAGATARALRRRSASTRYSVLVISVAVSVIAPIATWTWFPFELGSGVQISKMAKQPILKSERPIADPTVDLPTVDSGGVGAAIVQNSPIGDSQLPDANPGEFRTIADPTPVPTWWHRTETAMRPWLTWIVAVWIVGVVVCSMRPLLGWHTLRRLQRVGVSPVSEEVLAVLRRVSVRLGLRRAVRVLQSTLARVPVVVGYLRPVILLPVSVLTSIPPAQLEAILAHELAHVRRHDFIVNLLQTLVETLFFYHPAVWWLSHQIRVEREHCCDDLVVKFFGNRIEYGRALLAIEELRGEISVLALGATDGSLLSRVRRIVGFKSDRAVNSPWSALSLIACSIGVILAMSILGWHGLADTPEDTPKTLNGLRTKMTLLTEKPAVGLPLKVKIELENLGTVERTHESQRANPENRLEVIGPDGKPCEFINGPNQIQQSSAKIKPGETVTLFAEVDVSLMYLMSRAGEYKVRLRGPDAFDAGRDDPTRVHPIPTSNTIAVTLAPGQLNDIQSTFVRLREKAPQGWDISTHDKSIIGIPLAFKKGDLQRGLLHLLFLADPKTEEHKRMDRVPYEYLGQTTLGHAYLAVPPDAAVDWPKCVEQIRGLLPNSVSLADAVRDFNAENKKLERGQDQPPLTEEEVIAAIKKSDWKRDVPDVSEREFQEFKAIAETRRLPKGSNLEVLTGLAPDAFTLLDLWSIRIYMPALERPGIAGFSIRNTVIREERIDPESVAWGKPDVEGLSIGVFLFPKKDKYQIGEKVQLRLFVRNDSQQLIKDMTFWNITWPDPTDFTVTDQTASKVAVRNVNKEWSEEKWIAGAMAGALAPGETHAFRVPFELSIGGAGADKKVGRIIDARPGQTLQLRVRTATGSDRLRGKDELVPESGALMLQVADKPADNSGVQAHFPPLEFRFAANLPDSDVEPRVPVGYEQRHYPNNSVIGRMVAKDRGFIWCSVRNQKEDKVSLPVERVQGEVRDALVADTDEHALAWNRKWSVEECNAVPDPSAEGKYSIQLKLTAAGGTAFQALTKAHPNQHLAIIVNGEIIAAPIVRNEIGRDIAITGNFSREQADKLAVAIRTGQAVPAKPEPPAKPANQNNKLGTLSGRFEYDGEPPVPKELWPELVALEANSKPQRDDMGRVFGYQLGYLSFLQQKIRPDTRDASLLVGKDHGIANVLVWVESEKIPWTSPEGIPPAVTIQLKDGNLSPRMAVLLAGQTLQLKSLDPVSFNLRGSPMKSANSAFNVMLEPGEGKSLRQLRFPEAEKLPCRIQSDLGPWVASYVFVRGNPYVAVSQPDGSFSIPNLPPGNWDFRVWHEHIGWVNHWPKGSFQQTIKPGENSLGTIKLKPELFAKKPPEGAARQLRQQQLSAKADIAPNGEIAGRLVELATGKPVEGATIACGAIINDSGQGGGANAVTDANGHYHLPVPSPGIYNVWLKKFDKEPLMTAAADDGIVVEAGSVSASRLHLVAGRKVMGSVVDVDGKPFANLAVNCNSAARPLSGGIQSVKTMADGTFEFLLPPGKAYIYAIESVPQSNDNVFGAGRAAHVHYMVPETEEIAPLTLTLRKSESKFGDPKWLYRSTPGTSIVRRIGNQHVTGTVVDETGKPIAGAKVFRETGPIIITNDKGEFHVETLKGEQFVMHGFASGHHVWFGTPTSGDVLKIVMARKQSAKPAK